MSNLLERISQLAEYAHITITGLERQIGASKGVLSRAIQNNTDIQAKWVCKIVENYPQYSSNWLLTGNYSLELANRLSWIINLIYDHTRDNDTERIADILGVSQIELINFTNNLIFPKQPLDFVALVKEYPDINYEWLLTGKGKPLNVEESIFVNKLKDQYQREYIDRISNELNSPKNQIVDFSLATDRKIAIQQIPLYELNASAGIMAIFNDISINPTDYLRIPNLPSVDGAIYVCGESMMPLLKSGDIVIFKKLSLSMDSILWGQIYLLSFEVCGDYFTVVKYIQKSDRPDSIRLVSENSRYEPKDIPLSSIQALAIVKASITFHTIE